MGPKKTQEEEVMAALPFLVNTLLSIEKGRVATKVRQSHFKRLNREDPETDELVLRQQELEDYLVSRIAKIIQTHPAYGWFHQINGIGNENIAKVVGLIDITKPPSVSSLWKFAGYHVNKNGKAPKRVRGGGKLDYNSDLRSMCWRLAGAIMKSGIRYFCVKCEAQRPPVSKGKEPKCGECGCEVFEVKAISKYAEYYLKKKANYYAKYKREGRKIVPASELPKYANGKKYEPKGMISIDHVHNQALRKMIKLFLANLWLVWREAENLPTRSLYVEEKLGHTGIIDPWEMVDKKEKKVV